MNKLLALFALVPVLAFSANACKNGEESVFSFQTGTGKTASICTGKTDTTEYMVYRFGTDSVTELEYPSIPAGSFSKFVYRSYMRGGGTKNEGLDLNSIEFHNGEYLYQIYQEYTAATNQTKVGIHVASEKTGKKIEIVGKPNTVNGGLANLRFDARVPKE
jgi:hypothetical protein